MTGTQGSRSYGKDRKRQKRYLPDECTYCGSDPYCAWYKPSARSFVAVCKRHRPKGAQTLPRYRTYERTLGKGSVKSP